MERKSFLVFFLRIYLLYKRTIRNRIRKQLKSVYVCLGGGGEGKTLAWFWVSLLCFPLSEQPVRSAGDGWLHSPSLSPNTPLHPLPRRTPPHPPHPAQSGRAQRRMWRSVSSSAVLSLSRSIKRRRTHAGRLKSPPTLPYGW